MSYSVIIPYQHLEERESLLYKCIESLDQSSNKELEICVHEIGLEPHLNLSPQYKYLFTEYSGIFHRAWAINRGAKRLSTNEMLVLMDGDLVVDENWYQELIQCTWPSVGWGKIKCLDSKGRIEVTKTPSRGSAAGGITVVPSSLFFSVAGIPEDFIGSWGGEDNAFWSKLVSLGHKFKSFNSTITHLYHHKTTPRVRTIQRYALEMHHWNKAQWDEHIRQSLLTYGSEVPSNEQRSELISIKSKAKLSIAMLSWIRPDKLIETLTSLNETLTVPVNLTLMVQGSEHLSQEQRSVIINLASRFHRRDVFFTQGNIGTGPARKHLLARSLRRFYAPYINLADDDTSYTKDSVESAIDLLDRDLSIGIVGIHYKPMVYRLDSQTSPTKLLSIRPLSSQEPVDSTGSASAIIRRQVFDLCSIDSNYKLGYWDLDLFLQARSIGWKIVNYKAFNDMKAVNNWGGSREYRSARMNRKEIEKSRKLFTKKWGISG